jgi:hypothetical protein
LIFTANRVVACAGGCHADLVLVQGEGAHGLPSGSKDESGLPH